MRALAAVALAAAASVVPTADALPPIPGWPLGTTCHYTQVLATAADGFLFSIEGGPLLPVTDTGEQVTNVTVTCTVEIVPATYPAVTMGGTSTSIAGVAYLPRQARLVPTGANPAITMCSRLTWTDSAGVDRTGGSCVAR